MEKALRAKIRLYEEREKRHIKRAEEQNKKIRALRNAVHALADDERYIEVDDLSDDEMLTGEEENGEQDANPGGSDLPDPVLDEVEDVFRCSDCQWELVEGICQGCGLEHTFVEGNEDIELSRSVVVDGNGCHPDRQLAPRGTTPVNEVQPWMKLSVPIQYRDCFGHVQDEFLALLSRGATRAMCERYNLEFTMERGIVAWADHDLYETYAGPTMQNGDFWKIYLGRRVDLDKEDADGSDFMNDLLEEVLLFPLSYSGVTRWETVLERPRIWATRPVAPAAIQDTDDDSDEDLDLDSEKSWSPRYAREENMENKLNDGPVKRFEEYDTADDNASDVSDQDDAPSLQAIRANAPDAGYESESSEFVSESEHDIEQAEEHIVEDCVCSEAVHLPAEAEHEKPDQPLVISVDDEEMSSADEDFDSQEELSGDEYVIWLGPYGVQRAQTL